MESKYIQKMIKRILEESESDSWSSAVLEWEIDEVIEDEDAESVCVCGKENIRYLYQIKNKKNGKVLFPIGSSCIQKFEREDLNELTAIKEKLFKLYHAVKKREYISLNSTYFSRKLLKYLFLEGAFKATKYNKNNPEEDYEFMLDMFNKRGEPTEKQNRKIKAIIVKSIKPYLEEKIKIV